MEENFAKNLAEVDTLLTLLHLKTRAIRRQDLNEPRAQILLKLLYAAQTQMPQVELADTLQLSVSQVQKLTEELQKQGFVSRKAGAPRGGFYVTLTENGKIEAQSCLDMRAANEYSLLNQVLAQHAQGGGTITDILEQIKTELVKRAA